MSLSDPTPENLRKAADDFGLSFFKPITLEHIPVILCAAADTIAEQQREIERLRAGYQEAIYGITECRYGCPGKQGEYSPFQYSWQDWQVSKARQRTIQGARKQKARRLHNVRPFFINRV